MPEPLLIILMIFVPVISIFFTAMFSDLYGYSSKTLLRIATSLILTQLCLASWLIVAGCSSNKVLSTEIVTPYVIDGTQYIMGKNRRTGELEPVNLNKVSGKYVGENQQVKIIHNSQSTYGIVWAEDLTQYEIVSHEPTDGLKRGK